MIFSIYELIGLLILFSGAGVICGLTSWLLDYTFQPYSINKWYLPLLAKWILRKDKNYKIYVTLGADSLVTNAQEKFWFKILGGCAVCFNIWLALVSWTLICVFSPFPWFFGFPYIMVSSFTIRRLLGVE